MSRETELGGGKLSAEQVREAIEKRFDFDVWIPKERWQAIADELNAELGEDGGAMNNLQFIIKDNSRYAMHVGVELCEQGDFDSVTEAFRWLMQERDDSKKESGKAMSDNG